MPSFKKFNESWVKTAAPRLIWRYRKTTWRLRALPDFIIIGAQKAGTTSMFRYLSQHSKLLPSCVKEVHFFDGGLNSDVDNFAKGEGWYRAHFPLKKHLNDHSKTFEASPLYIFNPFTAKRIFDLVPEVKIIALLRNPTERAISHYFREKRKGRESLPILEALQEEEKRLESVDNNKDYKHKNFRHFTYKRRGLYKEQIERFLSYFPMQQMFVLSSEDFFREPDHTLRQVFEFVGVDTGFKIKDLRPRAVGKNKRKVHADVYQYLNDYFLPHNQALYTLLGKSYEW
jgi:hypothetical protein